MENRFLKRETCCRLLGIDDQDPVPVMTGMLLLFFLFVAYFMLRPVREAMGVAGGVDNLQWLFSATFIATLGVLPLFGLAASRLPRHRLLPLFYGLSAAVLVVFAGLFHTVPDDTWVARAFYVWLSVFSLFATSLGWSVLADAFRVSRAKRTFALISGGASLGGLTGPLLGVLLVERIGDAGLLLCSAALLCASALAGVRLHRWQQASAGVDPMQQTRNAIIGGHPFAGASTAFRSRYLMAIMLFVILAASLNTFLYIEQARWIAERFMSREAQIKAFSLIDATVQSLSLIIQVFITGRIASRLGVTVLLTAVPLMVMAGLLALAAAPAFGLFIGLMVLRRVGEYALIKPGREMLYAVVPLEQKYKSKNFIDTVVYRAGDAASAWVKGLIDMVAAHPAIASLAGAVLAAGWALCGYVLGRMERRIEAQEKTPSDTIKALAGSEKQ